mmetsp:Transcript_10836/g.29989  ORF Transcript_10836/g.29989 Transcript_10836/m.29989 type:complete len:97 (-) Transcript_10836:229-519(-)
MLPAAGSPREKAFALQQAQKEMLHPDLFPSTAETNRQVQAFLTNTHCGRRESEALDMPCSRATSQSTAFSDDAAKGVEICDMEIICRRIGDDVSVL